MKKRLTPKIEVSSILVLGASSSFAAGIAFLLQVFLARGLTPDEFGKLSASLAIINILTPLAVFGIPHFWLKVFGADGWRGFRWIVPSFFLVGFNVVCAIVILVVLAQFSPDDRSFAKTLLLLSVFLASKVSLELVSAKLQLEEKYGWLAVWQLLPHLLIFLPVFLGIWLFAEIIVLDFVVLIYMVASSVVVIWGIQQLYRFFRGSIQLVGHSNKAEIFQSVSSARRHDVAEEITRLVSLVWPFGLAGVFSLINHQSDIVLIRYIIGNEASGTYNIAFTVMAGVYILPGVIYQKYLLPKIHRWANKDLLGLYHFYRRGNIFMLALGLLVAFVIWLVSPWAIPRLFGEAYKASVSLLNLLALCAPIVFMAHNAGAILETGNYMYHKVKLMGCIAFANILLNVVLIPIYGLIGAAVATVISNLILLLVYQNSARNGVFAFVSIER